MVYDNLKELPSFTNMLSTTTLINIRIVIKLFGGAVLVVIP